MKMLQSIYSHFLLMSLLFIAGCGGDDDGFPTGQCGGTDNPCAAYAIGLEVTPKLATLAVATQTPYKAVATYSDGVLLDVTDEVMWSSSEDAIATISNVGVAIATAAGQTQITATLSPEQQGGLTLVDSGILNVTDAKLTALNIEPGQAEILVGMQQAFSVHALYADGHQQDVTQDVTWSVDDASIATISNEQAMQGVAKGLNVGVTGIKALWAEQTATAVLAVLSAQPSQLIINPIDQSLPKGTSLQYQAHLLLDNGLSLDVTQQSLWRSSSAEIASIDDGAFLTASQLGGTNVSASLVFADINLSAATTATVTDAAAESLLVTPSNGLFPQGTKGTYVATAYFSDGQVKDVTRNSLWSTSNDSVIAIEAQGSQAGDATALSVGATDIMATYGELTSTANAEVTNATLAAIQLSPLNDQVPAGTSVQYQANGIYSDGSIRDLTQLGYWQSSETSVASIGLTGGLSGRADTYAAGSTQISFTYMGVEQVTGLTVTAATMTALQISPINERDPIGTEGQYRAIAFYSDGHSQEVTQDASWVSDAPNIVSIVNTGANGGFASGLAVGSTNISASYGGIKTGRASAASDKSVGVAYPNSATVSNKTQATVTSAILQSLVITPNNASIAKGNYQQYRLYGLFSDGSSKEVTPYAFWQTSDANIAQISRFGRTHGLATGEVGIAARYLGMQITATLTVTDAVITSLQVAPAVSTLISGYQLQLVATAYYSDAHSSDVSELANWVSTRSDIAEVGATGNIGGLVHGLEQGSTQIEVSFDGMQADARVDVTSAILESVSLTPTDASIVAGNSQQYSFIGFFSDGTHQDLTQQASWQSSALDIATIDKQGLATSYKEGVSEIKASYIGFSSTATLRVTQATVTALQITPNNVVVPLGTKGQYQADAFYSDGSRSDVTKLAIWSVSDSSVVSMTPAGTGAGRAEAAKVGTTEVQAVFDGVSSTAKATVSNAIIEQLIVSPSSASVSLGLTQTYQAVGIFSDGTHKDLTRQSNWFSSVASIATVSRLGVAHTYAVGEVTITANYAGLVGTAALMVSDRALDYIKMTPTLVEVPLGTEGQFTARAYYTDKSSEDITQIATWRSADNTVVQVATEAPNAGYAKGVGVGQTAITVEYKGRTDTAVVRVNDAAVVELNVSPHDKTIPAGLEQAYQAFAVFSDGSNKDVTLASSWQSSVLSVASIDAEGIAHTIVEGQTGIKASYRGQTATTTLFVTAVELLEIQVTPSISQVNINEQQQYTARAFYSDGHSEDVTQLATWSVGDEIIAHVVTVGKEAGLVSGASHGRTSVKASFKAINGLALVTVTDIEYLGVNIEPADSSIKINDTRQYIAYAVYENAAGDISTKNVTLLSDWYVSKPNIAAISDRGLATGHEVGKTDVFAIYNNIEGQANLTVIDTYVVRVKVSPEHLKAPVGSKGGYRARAEYSHGLPPEDITEKASWVSSDPDIVHIVASGYKGGRATAVAVGSSDITATYQGVSDTTLGTVTPAVLVSVEITPKVDSLYTQSYFQFTGLAHYSDGSTSDITLDANWKSDDPSVIEIDTGNINAGRAIGYAESNSATISMSYQKLTDSMELLVKPVEPTKVEIIPSSMTIANGSYQEVQVMVTFTDGSVFDYADYVDWSSTDNDVAFGAKSIVTASGVGTATVTAKFGAITGSALVTVTPNN